MAARRRPCAERFSWFPIGWLLHRFFILTQPMETLEIRWDMMDSAISNISVCLHFIPAFPQSLWYPRHLPNGFLYHLDHVECVSWVTFYEDDICIPSYCIYSSILVGCFVYFPRTSKFLFKIKNTAKDAKGKYKNPSEPILLTTVHMLFWTVLLLAKLKLVR
jgi:hypothetical protein